MSLPGLFFLVIIIIVVILAIKTMNPKLDWNYETGERILWYNDPLDIYYRKSIVLWKKKM